MDHQNLIKWEGNTVVVYRQPLAGSGGRRNNGKNLTVDRKKAYQGEISKKTLAKTSATIRAWLNVINEGNKVRKGKKLQIVMITLTLSSQQDYDNTESDKFIKAELLEPFMKWLRYTYDIVHYFWRAEPQENGNIHFHILTDRFIDKKKIQEKWNYLQGKHGLLRDYISKYKKENPPSTHVRSFSGSAKSISYVCDYLTKNEGRRKIQGLQMRFSNSVSKLKIMPATIEQSIQEELFENLEKYAEWKHYDDYFLVYKFESDANELFRFDSLFTEPRLYYRLCYTLMYVLGYDYQFIELLNLVFSNKWGAIFYLQENNLDAAQVKTFKGLLEKNEIYTLDCLYDPFLWY